MATKVITVDDIDGYEGEDVAKRDFEVGGTKYAIDLGDANFKKLVGDPYDNAVAEAFWGRRL